MPEKINIPERLIRLMGSDIDVDVEKRILKRALFVTRSIASDGGIVVPEGINIKFYEQNPVVLEMHGYTSGAFPVVGRSLALRKVDGGMESETQFADTQRGSELAYLYGVNEKKEIYARAWSFGWENVDIETWSLDKAKQWLGKDWDDDLVPSWAREKDSVWVVTECVMNEYSAVALGADRKALSRAFTDSNITLAGELIANMDLHQAGLDLAEVKSELKSERARIEKLEHDIQVLRGDGASAAARGDSEAIAAEVRELIAHVRKLRGNPK